VNQAIYLGDIFACQANAIAFESSPIHVFLGLAKGPILFFHKGTACPPQSLGRQSKAEFSLDV
jgi:hypothetical protein